MTYNGLVIPSFPLHLAYTLTTKQRSTVCNIRCLYWLVCPHFTLLRSCLFFFFIVFGYQVFLVFLSLMCNLFLLSCYIYNLTTWISTNSIMILFYKAELLNMELNHRLLSLLQDQHHSESTDWFYLPDSIDFWWIFSKPASCENQAWIIHLDFCVDTVFRDAWSCPGHFG